MTDKGFYCQAGRFYIDPWKPVDRAVITHAHADHARWGHASYLCAEPGEGVLRTRMGDKAAIESIPYGERLSLGDATVSLHPAGHVLGSAQVRVEHRGEVWVVSGDYKRNVDPTCTPFEPVRCHTFITESTFGLPVYSWPESHHVFDDMKRWRERAHADGRSCLLMTYALGKAQRILHGMQDFHGPILVHGAIEKLLPAYRDAGIDLPEVLPASAEQAKATKGKVLILAPPSAAGSPWVKKFGPLSTGFASGWMAIRGTRRRRALDRGFVLSDHADWNGLQQTIRETGAERVGVTHGTTDVMVRWLKEQGLDAWAIQTRFVGESTTTDDDSVEGQ